MKMEKSERKTCVIRHLKWKPHHQSVLVSIVALWWLMVENPENYRALERSLVLKLPTQIKKSLWKKSLPTHTHFKMAQDLWGCLFMNSCFEHGFDWDVVYWAICWRRSTVAMARNYCVDTREKEESLSKGRDSDFMVEDCFF